MAKRKGTDTRQAWMATRLMTDSEWARWADAGRDERKRMQRRLLDTITDEEAYTLIATGWLPRHLESRAGRLARANLRGLSR